MTWMHNVLKRWAVLMLPAVIASLGLGYVFGASLRLAVSVAALLVSVLLGHLLFKLVDTSLSRRARANAPFAWEVWINDVKVGTVTDAEYAAIQCLALHDGSSAVAQLLNLGRVAMVIVSRLFVGLTLGIAWSAIALALLEPEAHIAMIRALSNADPAALTHWTRTLVQYGALFMVVQICAMAVMGVRFGFRNHYRAAIATMLRQHFNTPADGDIRLVRMSLRSGLPTPQFGYAHD
ncbi:hypothetical protein [Burkholderiaceae bacterium 26]|uniref:hypothetical protein n=1 Tax=Ralstonia holmesii TaxID=3058602 RepID=UPI0005EB7C92|nr:hypothetical protein UB44_16900 [Burkholderiaceae bacterium 26]